MQWLYINNELKYLFFNQLHRLDSLIGKDLKQVDSLGKILNIYFAVGVKCFFSCFSSIGRENHHAAYFRISREGYRFACGIWVYLNFKVTGCLLSTQRYIIRKNS